MAVSWLRPSEQPNFVVEWIWYCYGKTNYFFHNLWNNIQRKKNDFIVNYEHKRSASNHSLLQHFKKKNAHPRHGPTNAFSLSMYMHVLGIMLSPLKEWDQKLDVFILLIYITIQIQSAILLKIHFSLMTVNTHLIR